MPFTVNNDVKIYYEVQGEGFPLLLIMGLGGHSHSWGNQVEEFSKYFKVITVDNRGAGKSDKPDELYSMRLYSKDIKAVLDELKIEKVYVLGLSMGGLIAQEFYHSNSERVKALVLGCTGVGSGDPAFLYPSIKVMDTLNLMPHSKEDIFEVMQKKVSVFYHPDYIKKNPDLVRNMLEDLREAPQPSYAYKRQLKSCFLTPAYWNSPRLYRIKVPVLIIHGEDDQVWPLGNAKFLHSHIQNSQFEVIKNAAHMFFLEKFEEFNQKVLKFLNSIAD